MIPLRAGDPPHLGPYRLLARLGEGAQGAVFLAQPLFYDSDSQQDSQGSPPPPGDLVAVKLLHPDLVGDVEARARFLREMSVAKQVARFCTAQVLDADVAGDRPYIVSEYIEGPSLYRLVGDEGPRTGGALERLAIGTATALAAIHKAGIVHRDFKPQNVLIGPDGPRVIDFGVARALGTSATISAGMVGTPSYMAPEQFAGETVGPPADVFAWGVTVAFAATARPAFGNDTIPAVMHRILHADPDLSGLPTPLGDLVAASLAKDPAARPTAERIMLALVGHDPSDFGTPFAAMTPPRSATPSDSGMPPVFTPSGSAAPSGSTPSGSGAPDAFTTPIGSATSPGSPSPTGSGTPLGSAAASDFTKPFAAMPPSGSAPASGLTRPSGAPSDPANRARPRRLRTALVAAGVVGALVGGGLLFARIGGSSRPNPHPAVVARVSQHASAAPSSAPPKKPHKATPKAHPGPRRPKGTAGRACQSDVSVPATSDHGTLAAQYCDVWLPAGGVPVYSRPDGGSPVVGRLLSGRTANWFVGQAGGGRYQQGKWWNQNWAYTLADGAHGQWGWVPIVYFQGGDNGMADATLLGCGARCHPY
jgi:serine/threonine protein kinase